MRGGRLGRWKAVAVHELQAIMSKNRIILSWARVCHGWVGDLVTGDVRGSCSEPLAK